MRPLLAVSEFFADDLHWSAAEAVRKGLNAQAWAKTLVERGYVAQLIDRSALAQFYRAVRESMRAANVVRLGGQIGSGDVPLAPGLAMSGQYQTMGVMELTSRGLLPSSESLSSTLPFRSDTPGLPTQGGLDELAETLIGTQQLPLASTSPKGQKQRERWLFTVRSEANPDYSITPLMIFRSR